MPQARSDVVAYVALGANLGDAAASVHAAMDAIDQVPNCRVTRRSSLYRSAPVQAAGPDFVNAVVAVQTTRTAPDLLATLQNIEQVAGRERPYPNAPRTLDLDLLLYGDARIDSPTLTVPHPRMLQRAFVLLPLAELASQSVSEAQLHAVGDQAIVRL